LVGKLSDSDTSQQWWLYILLTAKGRYYTGVTTDTQRRLLEHQRTAGGIGKGSRSDTVRSTKNSRGSKGAKALRGQGPLTLLYRDSVGNRSNALQLEYKVKQLSKTQKRELVKLQIPVTDFLVSLND